MVDALQALTACVAVAILFCGLDDLFIDCFYYAWRGATLPRRRRIPKLSEDELRAAPQQTIGVMIPAWHEHAVIGRMLDNTLKTVHYSNFEVFVGTYPNDAATRKVVAECAARNPRVHPVVCPNDGPTNKADCLNWIIQGIFQFERTSGKTVEILMLHDSEDIIHPLSFALVNRLVPRFPMVQLPVLPLEQPVKNVTGGTYLDEFAESHLKDMLVRERLSGMVPSAGVGTAFSRGAVALLAEKYGDEIFNTRTFTEDYDLAFRLRRLGQRSILVQYRVARPQGGAELVGTREYFPDVFKDAVRQKSRWTLGIVFHGWREMGWAGDWSMRYMIWRDRKTLLTNVVTMAAYVLLVEAAAASAVKASHPSWAPPDLILPGSWVWDVIWIDTLLLANRWAQRVVAVLRVSSWKQASVSLPRIVWGNVINFCAVARAAQLFFKTAVLGKKVAWAKTEHAYPSEAELAALLGG
jgi:bacteriophage N4 adsorption protein B